MHECIYNEPPRIAVPATSDRLVIALDKRVKKLYPHKIIMKEFSLPRTNAVSTLSQDQTCFLYRYFRVKQKKKIIRIGKVDLLNRGKQKDVSSKF